MKALPFSDVTGKRGSLCEPSEATHILLNLPDPLGETYLPVITKGSRRGAACWTWNGDTENPTLKPSLLTKYGKQGREVSHCWITDGKAHYLDDSTHEFKGQTLDLLEVDEW